MGIMATSSTVTRLRIAEAVTPAILSSVPDKLKQFCFRSIDATTDERSWGWVCFDDMLDPAWQTAPPEKGEYMAFALRVDVRKIPSSILKKDLAVALKEEEKKNKEVGKTFTSRERKKELKEQVRLKLLSRIPPQPTTVDVVWSTSRNILHVTTNSSKLLDLLSDYFTLTFDLHVEPLTPYALAASMLDETAMARLDSLEPTRFA
jgi:DNA recombination-dependent growth factor C